MAQSAWQREQDRQHALFGGVEFDDPVAPQAFALARLVHSGQVEPSWAEDHLTILEIVCESGLDRHACDMLRKTIERLSGRTAFMESAAGATHVHVRTKDGGELIIHKSVRPDAPPGAWQVTRFFPERKGSSTMVPWGHRYARSVEDALKESWGEYGGLELLARKNPIAAHYGRRRLPVQVLGPTWPGTVGYWDARFDDGEEGTLAATDLYTPTGARWQDPAKRKNPDAPLRELERAAFAGDPEAEEALQRARCRAGQHQLWPISWQGASGESYRSCVRCGASVASVPFRRNPDPRLRELERAALAGDPDAWQRYLRTLRRQGEGPYLETLQRLGREGFKPARVEWLRASFPAHTVRPQSPTEATQALLWWLQNYDDLFPDLSGTMGDLSWEVTIFTAAQFDELGYDGFGAELILHNEGGLNRLLMGYTGHRPSNVLLDANLVAFLSRLGWRYETLSPMFFGLYRAGQPKLFTGSWNL